MARAYAARLGCIAMIFELFKHMLKGDSLATGVYHALSLLIVFSVLGYVIGWMTEGMIRQSLESNFRQKIENRRLDPGNSATKPT